MTTSASGDDLDTILKNLITYEQAKEIYESMKVTFQNVERKLINIKIDLDETLQMLYKLKNENGQQR